MNRLKDKVAIVTGAASGYGEGMARRFAREGAKVVVADINARGAEKLAAEIGAAALGVQTDVSQAGEIREMVEAAMQAFGRIDILVNNAGFTHRRGSLLDVEEDLFDLMGAVNMKAIYHATRAVVPLMDAQGGGAILNIASIYASRPQVGLTWYAASKGWVVSATKAMALELAPRKIRVNCLCPGSGETGMMARFLGDAAPSSGGAASAVPLGRLSRPDDMGDAAVFLVSDEASLVTGVALAVDGGQHL